MKKAAKPLATLAAESSWKDLDKEEDKLPELPGGVPRITFSAYAYQKLCYWEAMSQKDEMSCFGVATRKAEPLRITELYIPQQEVTINSTDMTAEGIADMWGTLTALKLDPIQFARIWIHTHPFKSAPSVKDFQTCREVFGACDWFVMLIKGNDGFTAYLYSMTGVPVRNELAVGIDYCNPGLPGKITKGWSKSFKANVQPEPSKVNVRTNPHIKGYLDYSHVCRGLGSSKDDKNGNKKEGE